MFDTSYTFHLIDHKQQLTDGRYLCNWSYNFQSKRRRYIVTVESYVGHIYVIKYHAACHSASKNKYNLLFNDEKPAPIIRTCINIMLQFYQTDPLASFGFIGSHSINKQHKGKSINEDKANTQRFRIYQALMFNFFGTETFEHARSIDHSAYLLTNRRNDQIDVFRRDAEKMFADLYISFDV